MAWRPRDIESFLKVKTAWLEIIYIKKRTKSVSKKRNKKNKQKEQPYKKIGLFFLSSESPLTAYISLISITGIINVFSVFTFFKRKPVLKTFDNFFETEMV